MNTTCGGALGNIGNCFSGLHGTGHLRIGIIVLVLLQITHQILSFLLGTGGICMTIF